MLLTNMQRESILRTLYPKHRDASPHFSALTPQASTNLDAAAPSVAFHITLETPPAIMYGTPQESVGALISGICEVDLTACGGGGGGGGVALQEVAMSIEQVVRYRLPPNVLRRSARAPEQRNVLATWDLLQHPHILASRTFAYPFSHLLPGTLPPTCQTPLFSVEYVVRAWASGRDLRRSEATLPLQIFRSVVAVRDKTSVRIFPPTTLTLSMILPTALFPNSKVKAEMRIEGVVAPVQQRFKRWQLKRVNWRVDEIVRVRFGEKPEDEHEFKQTLGFGVHKSGWKTDYLLQNGCIELFSPDFCPGVLEKAHKDLQDPVAGLSVSHQLVCELLIAEEVLPNPAAKQGVLSGSARVLRMQFAFPVCDRPGLGISWEDEVPPMYADIPLSPPEYRNVASLPALEEFKMSTPAFSPLLAPLSPTLRHLDGSMRGLESRGEVVRPARPAAASGSVPPSARQSPALTPFLSAITPISSTHTVDSVLSQANAPSEATNNSAP